MGRPRVIPENGDVSPAKVAARMGYEDLRGFHAVLPDLNRRGFPPADPTTGNYCIEAVDRWRRLRHPVLFPELTSNAAGADADVMRQRLAGMGGGRR